MNCNQVLIIPTIERHRFSSLLPTWQEVFIPAKRKALGLINGTSFFPYRVSWGWRWAFSSSFRRLFFPCATVQASLSLPPSLPLTFISLSLACSNRGSGFTNLSINKLQFARLTCFT